MGVVGVGGRCTVGLEAVLVGDRTIGMTEIKGLRVRELLYCTVP